MQAGKAAGIPERTLKRRFKAATGVPLIDYLQNIRIEHGKHLLETTSLSRVKQARGDLRKHHGWKAGYWLPAFC